MPSFAVEGFKKKSSYKRTQYSNPNYSQRSSTKLNDQD